MALMGDRVSLPSKLIVLMVVGASVIALVVGYVLGHYGDRGRGPGD